MPYKHGPGWEKELNGSRMFGSLSVFYFYSISIMWKLESGVSGGHEVDGRLEKDRVRRVGIIRGEKKCGR